MREREFAVGGRVKFAGGIAVIVDVSSDDRGKTLYDVVMEEISGTAYRAVPGHLLKWIGPNWEVKRSHVNVKEATFFELPVGSLLGVVALNHWGGLEYETSDPENTIFVARISGRKVFIHSTGIQMSAKELSELSEKKALKVLYMGEK